MATLLSIQNLAKAFGARPLFEGVSFNISEGERIGLIGPNGAGKSTLLRLLAGGDAPDAGTIACRQGLRIGHLAQVPSFTPGRSVRDSILEGGAGSAEHAWELEARADALIAKLELWGEAVGADTAVDSLSGGWRKRVALARELLREPDLLLLDEPTNHLDVDGILWLEKLLGKAPFAVITVTHDRLFLQRVATRILELDRRNAGGLLSVDASFGTFLERKAEIMAAQEQREQALRNTLRREIEWLRRGAQARTTKQEARIQRAGALANEVEELEIRNQVRITELDFADNGRAPKRLVDARGLCKRYGDKLILSSLDLLLVPGSRVGLLGPNGCGKSTLLRLLVGEEKPDQGEVLRSMGLEIAYFAQHRESLDADKSLMEALCPKGDHVDFRGTRIHVRGYLDRFLFRQEQMPMPVGQLSGGEQSRLAIARLMLRPANLLVLDEPTNDLDLPTLNVLEEALTTFTGAVLLVSHDRAFLDRVATQILAFHTRPGEEGRITAFASLDQWEAWHATQSEAPRAAARPKEPTRAQQVEPAGKRRKLSFKDQRDYDSIERRIAEGEARLNALQLEIERPEVASDAARLVTLGEEMSSVQSEVDRLYARFCELEAMLAP